MNMTHNYNNSLNNREALSQFLWVTSLMSADLARGLARYGLTESRASLFWRVGETGGLTQRALAERLDVSPRNITTLVDGLVETGFVRRADHPTDRRAVLVVLTKKGEKTYTRLQSEMTRFSALLFGNVAEKDLRVFEEILRHIGEVLSGLAKKAAPARRK